MVNKGKFEAKKCLNPIMKNVQQYQVWLCEVSYFVGQILSENEHGRDGRKWSFFATILLNNITSN